MSEPESLSVAPQSPDRNLALELVRVTEAAAMAAGRWVGRGDKNGGVGDGTGPECDVAVDPIDGTTLTAKGMSNAVAVLAVAPRGSMYDPSAVFYMDKLATGPEAADVVDIRYPVAENIHQVAKAKGGK